MGGRRPFRRPPTRSSHAHAQPPTLLPGPHRPTRRPYPRLRSSRDVGVSFGPTLARRGVRRRHRRPPNGVRRAQLARLFAVPESARRRGSEGRHPGSVRQRLAEAGAVRSHQRRTRCLDRRDHEASHRRPAPGGGTARRPASRRGRRRPFTIRRPVPRPCGRPHVRRTFVGWAPIQDP